MTNRKTNLIFISIISSIITIYIIIFHYLSKRETSTLKQIWKDLDKSQFYKNDTLQKANKISSFEALVYKLPLYIENESLISYSIRMTILKQKGFWELSFLDIFRNKDLFKKLKPKVNEFEKLYLLNKENSIEKIEAKLKQSIIKNDYEYLISHKIYTDVLKMKLFYFNISIENTLSLNISFLDNPNGKYLLYFSIFILGIAVWNYNKKYFLFK